MDIIKEPKQKKLYQNPYLFLTGAILLAISIWGLSSPSMLEVKSEDLHFSVVSQGSFEKSIDVFGTLRSNQQRLLTAVSDATVIEIILKSGALVTSESVILKMTDPELSQLVSIERLELVQQQANLEQLKLTQRRERLDELMTIVDLESQLELASLKREAKDKLYNSGIVSTLDHTDSVLTEKRVKKILAFREERIRHLDGFHKQSVQIFLEKLKQQKTKVSLLETKLSQLEVRAGMNGVVQKQSVELGQRVKAGDELAIVGSTSNMVAMMRVPQTKIAEVQLGQLVILDIGSRKINGKVSRIEPTVTQNTIGVEVEFDDESLLANVRPDMNVEGLIVIDRIHDTLFADTPPGVSEASTRSMYVLDEDRKSATRRLIKFGAVNRRYVQVIDGISNNETIVIARGDDIQAAKIKIIEN